MFGQHGNQGGGICALMLCELYENTANALSTGVNRWEYQRGGKLLCYNNTLSGSYSGHPSQTCNDDTADVDPVNQIQHPIDTYFWNNTSNGSLMSTTVSQTINYGGDIGIVPREDVHFWNQKVPFTGASGVGVGLLSARPSSGLVAGVGYWATDTKTLYRAVNSTTWEVFYTPYTYPHPLTA